MCGRQGAFMRQSMIDWPGGFAAAISAGGLARIQTNNRICRKHTF
jgi:hypothetical protein